MIKLSVLYPRSDGTRFDIDYYCNTHMELVRQKLGAACRRIAVEQGLAGGAPGTPPAYVAMGHLYFDSLADFQAVFPPHAASLLADIPNFTDIHPVIQISDVKM